MTTPNKTPSGLAPNCTRTYPKNSVPTPVFALVIGINTFQDFLVTSLGTPQENIRSLRNKEATRDAIITTFESLVSDARIKKNENAIIIYYAGHGARSEIPRLPNNEPAPEWTGWETNDQMIEMICPHDIGIPMNDNGDLVEGIPDRTVSCLLNTLADAKGNNITLFLDCCHSASISRIPTLQEVDGEIAVPRMIFSPPEITARCDYDIWINCTRVALIHPGFTSHFQASHIVLAACGRHESALEAPGKGGLFTYALLNALQKETIDRLTYTSLIHKLKLPIINCTLETCITTNAEIAGDSKDNTSGYSVTQGDVADGGNLAEKSQTWQTPHCEGLYAKRRLFNTKASGNNGSFILGRRMGKQKILQAGSVHGLVPNSRFTIHALDIATEDNIALGTLELAEPQTFTSTLEFSGSRFKVPHTFYAKQISSGSDFRVYCEDQELLTLVITDELEQIGISATSNSQLADICLEVKSGTVQFYRADQNIVKWIGARLLDSARYDDIWSIQHVLRRAIHFNHHLYRDAPLISNVQLELYKLKPWPQRSIWLLAPDGKDMFADAQGLDSPARIVINRFAYYGCTIVNNTEFPLYPYLFYFDPASLSIDPWYSSPISGRTNSPAKDDSHADCPLPAGGKLAIGHGGGNGRPFTFNLRDGDDTDIGFFKLFVSTKPVDLAVVSLKPKPEGVESDTRLTVRDAGLNHAEPTSGGASNSEGMETRASGAGPQIPDLWGTMVIPLVQTRS